MEKQYRKYLLGLAAGLVMGSAQAAAQANDVSNTSAAMRVNDAPWSNFNSEANSFEAGATQRSLTGMLISGSDERTRTLALSVNAVMNGLAPIPEPASYGMLLAGLAVLGWRARTRRPVL